MLFPNKNFREIKIDGIIIFQTGPISTLGIELFTPIVMAIEKIDVSSIIKEDTEAMSYGIHNGYTGGLY